GHGDGARPADGSALLVEYDRSAFTARRAQALAGAIGRLLEQLVRREPEVPLAKLELLAPAERALLAGPGAGEGHELPLETFGAHFLRAAERYAERPALTVDGVTIGYRELAARALATAGRIRAAGAGPEDVVAVATGRSADMVIAHLGVLLSGAAFLALDPEAPAARTATLLRELPPALVVLSGCRPPLPEAPALPVLRLDEPGPAAPPPSAPTAPAALDALAYIVFTSGTTGTPKPVGVSHRGVTKLIATQRARLGSAAGQRVLYYASPTFDAAFWQLCGTLCDGGELVVVPDACRLPGPELVSFIERERIDLVSVPPSVLGALPPQARLPKRVRLVVGAERLPASLARRWAARHPLVNAYGPSEATVNTCLHRCGPDEEEPVPIGRIDPGARGYIVDASLRLCPPDFPGELLIGGEGVARGYLGDPAKTAAAFIADPFVPGERCYRSGDRAVRRADGAIEFLGRLDDQIKLRGLRIEPGEIAAALEELPGVRQAAVLVRPGSGDRPQLVGYLVPEGADRPGGEQEVRTALRERLSAHLVPERIVAIERIPRLPSGKLDRRALPEPPAPERRAVREDDPGLAALCAAFATALELPRVHPDDDFFALGGSSLTAASLLHEVKVRTGRAPGFAELLAAPTPRGLAAATQHPDPLGPLLELRPQPAAEALAPVWFLPPLAGMSWCYAPLRRWLDPRRRMVGLQTPNLSGEEPAEEDFGRLTARWADAIRLERAQAAPAAPVHLVGWSFGGAAALGVAAQLQRRGVPTGLVAMLDSYPVAEWAERAPSEAESLRSALGMLGVDVSLAEAERLDARSAAELMARANPLLAGLESFEPKRMIDNFHAGPRLERSAVFGGYSGDLLVFTAERTAAAMASDWRAWRPFVDGRVRRVPVDAAHQDMVRERALETIGPALEEALRGLA
ncbi:MAG: amino acid adenylation domain-containing protein, partial [Pseudoclavibacter sp.]|nr:amino acid adenylation domain-containing protein [Pseudoclavibacter sp.]